MTLLLPEDIQRIKVYLDGTRPTILLWRGTEHRIIRISNHYRVAEGTLEDPIWRDYFEIVTSNWLMLIFRDRLNGSWGMEVLYD